MSKLEKLYPSDAFERLIAKIIAMTNKKELAEDVLSKIKDNDLSELIRIMRENGINDSSNPIDQGHYNQADVESFIKICIEKLTKDYDTHKTHANMMHLTHAP